MKEDILFSIFMCVRNGEELIERAISSVLNQTCQDWELIIVDNGSTDGTWGLIESRMKGDPRIKGIHLNQGIGWCKGASLCLKHAKGKYMTFLAADDFFTGDGSLSGVERCIEKEQPDIVWIGHMVVSQIEKRYIVCGGLIPEYRTYHKEEKIEEVFQIMSHLYYNAFFHFINIKFLKKCNIDFSEPFYGDCEGLTEAMCRSEKSVVLDQAVYVLCENTSQTAEAVPWGHNVMQWRSVKGALIREGVYDYDKLRCIAAIILRNNIGLLREVCNGAPIRDDEMNLIEKTSLERLIYVEHTLESSEWQEMFYYAGSENYEEMVIEDVKMLYENCAKEGYTEEEIRQCVNWIDHLILGRYQWQDGELVKRKEFYKDSFEHMRCALCSQKNQGVFGYELIMDMVLWITEETYEDWDKINQSYMKNGIKRIYELLFLATEIKKRNGMSEVIKIAKECMNILQQIKSHISENDFVQIMSDMKMVLEIKS